MNRDIVATLVLAALAQFAAFGKSVLVAYYFSIGTDPRIGHAFICTGGVMTAGPPRTIESADPYGRGHRCRPAGAGRYPQRNEHQKHHVFDQLKARLGGSPKARTFGVRGISIEPDADDVREAPAPTIANHGPAEVLEYLDALEETLAHKAQHKYLPMQPIYVPATLADTTRFTEWTGRKPKMLMCEGIARFVACYLDPYRSPRSA